MFRWSDGDGTPCQQQQRAVSEVSAEARWRGLAEISHDNESVGREEDGGTHCRLFLGVPSANDGEKCRRDARLDETEEEPLRKDGELVVRRWLAREGLTCAMRPEKEVQAGVTVTTIPQIRQ